MANSSWLDGLKTYMRVDGDDDNDIVIMVHDAAVEYLANAGVEQTEDNASLYTLAVNNMSLFWYDHRDSVGADGDFPTGLRMAVNQLKHNAVVKAAAEELSNG